jgi:hypothetical protein
MASVGKCLGIMATAGFAAASGTAYYVNSKIDKTMMEHAKAIAKDGTIPIGGMTKDGKMWDGKISVEDYQKKLNKKTQLTSLIMGFGAAVGTAIISGLTLLLRGKIKP